MYYNNKRLALSIFWVVLGAVLLILSTMEILDSAIYGGMGGGLIAVGILQIIRIGRYRRGGEYKENVDIEIADERNRYLRMKAWSFAGYAMVLVQAVASVIATVLGHELIQRVLLCSVALMVFAYWLSYMILSRRN